MKVPIRIDIYTYEIDISLIEKVIEINSYEYGIIFREPYSSDDTEVTIDYETVKMIIRENREIVDYKILRNYNWHENYDENVKAMFENLAESIGNK